MASRRAKIGITTIVFGILFPVIGFFSLGGVMSVLNIQSLSFFDVIEKLCCTSVLITIVGLGIYLTDND